MQLNRWESVHLPRGAEVDERLIPIIMSVLRFVPNLGLKDRVARVAQFAQFEERHVIRVQI